MVMLCVLLVDVGVFPRKSFKLIGGRVVVAFLFTTVATATVVVVVVAAEVGAPVKATPKASHRSSASSLLLSPIIELVALLFLVPPLLTGISIEKKSPNGSFATTADEDVDVPTPVLDDAIAFPSETSGAVTATEGDEEEGWSVSISKSILKRGSFPAAAMEEERDDEGDGGGGKELVLARGGGARGRANPVLLALEPALEEDEETDG
mmetsp:Transcript_4704/g.8560  ORF Transcript_4704/g.8560 Transcript_4704/m.8560 type:complete len:208 (-) Transcript_4704:1134-1757(-)